MRNVVGALSGQDSPWTLLHFGIDARLFSFFTLRTGLNQGYLTAGAGVRFLVFDLNFAVFTRELGMHVGDRPLAGMTLDSSIRW
jgi:membrane-associated PAP2 superfamily phosphatase